MSTLSSGGPPREVLPNKTVRDRLAGHLAQAPGIDPVISVRQRDTGQWPQPGLYIRSFIYPGFSGTVTVHSYEKAEHRLAIAEGSLGSLVLHGMDIFAVAYDNAAYLPDCPPSARNVPNNVSLSLHPDKTSTVPLQNGGRLLVQKRPLTTGKSQSEGEWAMQDETWADVTQVRRLTTYTDLQALLNHLGLGMGLDSDDLWTFTNQARKKIVTPFSLRRKLGSWLRPR